MFNQYFNENLLMLAKKAETMLKDTLSIVQLFIGNFEAKAEFYQEQNNTRENNLNMPVISYKGESAEQEMKFQGKTIHKNKKCNTWYTRYRLDGKQYYISGKTQKEVLIELKNQLNYVKKEKRKTLTLQDWYNQWLELFKIGKVKEVTIKDYKKTLRNIHSNILNKNIKQITSIEIIKNLEEINHERTKQTTYELLNGLFKKAKDFDIINKNIMDIIEKPKHIKEKGIALTIEEQKIFINVCKNYKYGDIFLITLFQGLRIGETLALTGKDINLDKNELRINKSYSVNGKFDTTKNEQSNRIMPIFNNSINILNKYKNYEDNRLFNISYNVPQKHLKKIIKEINNSQNKIRDISLHDLRHTFITNCKNKEIPEHIIQSWVGHTIGSQVTSKVYTHINQEDTMKYLEKYNKN